jgi:AcrR family transcriptional regulator
VGPEEVREAVLEASAALFADRGVDQVSLRDIAEAADIQLPLIRRYIGVRQVLVDTVFERLNEQVVHYITANPLAQFEYGRDTILGRWMAMLTYYALRGQTPPSSEAHPIYALGVIFERAFGTDPDVARRRAAQVTAISIGWRLAEDYLVAAAATDDVGIDSLRGDLNAIQRQIGATTWPTPTPGSAPA